MRHRRSTVPQVLTGQRQCLRADGQPKNAYDTLAEATSAMIGTARKAEISTRELNAYRCRRCGWYHVGRRRS